MKKWYEIRNLAHLEAEVLIYDEIGGYGVGAEQFLRELDTITAPVINLRVNSEGGEVFDGFAIYNALKRHPARIISHVDGLAASAATYPVLAGEEVRIAKNAFLMIHNPWSLVLGESGDMRSEADLLDKLRDTIANIYVDRTGKPLDEVRAWMNAETWFTADECLANGFADVIAEQEADAEVVNRRRRSVHNCVTKRTSITNRVKALGLDNAFKPKHANAVPSPDPAFAVGDRVGVVGSPHMEGQSSGVVQTITVEPAYGILFDGSEDIHRWYVQSEIASSGSGSSKDQPMGPMSKTSSAKFTRTEKPMITPEQFQEFAAVNPDAVKTAAKDLIEQERTAAREEAVNSAKPKNATAGELKAAFPEDREFVMDRLDVDAPIHEHKIAYADRLKAVNKTLNDRLGEMRGELAKHDPASAGRNPLNLGEPKDDAAPQPVSAERKNQLRRMAGLPVKA